MGSALSGACRLLPFASCTQAPSSGGKAASLLKKSSPDRLRKGLPNLSQWLQFDLIAHAFESSNKLLLNDLSVPLIEIIAS